MEQAQSTFAYVARDASGKRRSGQISGLDVTDAKRALRDKGLFPISLEAESGSASGLKPVRRRHRADRDLSQREIADLLVRLAKLSGRQITSERALAIIADGGEDRVSQAAARVRDSLREGAPLSRALREQAGIEDAVTLSLVGGAEVSGEMGSALKTAADIMENRLLVRRRVITGLMYPSILMFVALLSLGLIMIAIIPQFRPLVEDRFDLVPAVGRAVFALSGALSSLWPYLLAAILLIGFGMFMAARRGLLAGWLAQIGHRIPFVRRMMVRNQMMLILHVLGALLGREITLSGALRVVARSAPQGAVQRELGDVTQKVENGAALSAALRTSGLLPREAIEMIRIGEEAGDLSGMITRTSVDMREAADRDLERFLLLFQPALIVGVGLLIGVSLYALFSAIVSVNAISF